MVRGITTIDHQSELQEIEKLLKGQLKINFFGKSVIQISEDQTFKTISLDQITQKVWRAATACLGTKKQANNDEQRAFQAITDKLRGLYGECDLMIGKHNYL